MIKGSEQSKQPTYLTLGGDNQVTQGMSASLQLRWCIPYDRTHRIVRFVEAEDDVRARGCNGRGQILDPGSAPLHHVVARDGVEVRSRSLCPVLHYITSWTRTEDVVVMSWVVCVEWSRCEVVRAYVDEIHGAVDVENLGIVR